MVVADKIANSSKQYARRLKRIYVDPGFKRRKTKKQSSLEPENPRKRSRKSKKSGREDGRDAAVKGRSWVAPDVDEAVLGDVELVGEEAVDDVRAESALPPSPSVKHIHPCVCDLSSTQRKRIKKYVSHAEEMQHKYERRVKEIEEELARIEEERLEREREELEQQELFGDEYELIGKKKKRKKRSARRASMVSLGVRQVINFRKPPKLEVKATRTSQVRAQYTMYCGRRKPEISPIKPIKYDVETKIPVRLTRAYSLRMKVNRKIREAFESQPPEKPRIVVPSFF